MEAASGRRLDRARDIALQNNPLAAIRFVNLWDCGKKRLCVRVLRRIVDHFLARKLHHLPEIHHTHPVGHVADDVERMGDEDISKMIPLL